MSDYGGSLLHLRPSGLEIEVQKVIECDTGTGLRKLTDTKLT